MRTKQDINEMQCDGCGKIQKQIDDLYNCDIEDCKYEGLAICNDCYLNMKEQQNSEEKGK